MHSARRPMLLLLLVAAAACTTAPPPSGGTFEPSGCSGWVVTPSVNPTAGHDLLEGVAATLSGTVWAVGTATTPGAAARPVIERWDGHGWSVVDGPNVAGDGFLNAVTAIDSAQAWAVGSSRASDGPLKPLIERWDGTRWSVVPSAGTLRGDASLEGVSALGPSDVWAVGYRTVDGVNRPLILHWSGASWEMVDAPFTGDLGEGLNAVAAAGPDDVWAVGGYAQIGMGGGRTLALHWDGRGWRRISTPSAGLGTAFSGVAVPEGGTPWVVGGYRDPSGDRAFTAHQTGDRWRLSPVVPLGLASEDLNAVAAASPSDLWAVGSVNGGGNDHPILMHGDGRTWERVAAPSEPQGGRLASVAMLPTGEAWAVGSSFAVGGNDRTLAMRFCP